MTLIILISVFVSVAALTGGVVMLVTARRTTVAEERLDVLARSSAAISLGPGLLASLTDEDYHPRRVEQFVSRFVDLSALVQQAGVKQSPGKILLVALGFALFGGGVLALTPLPLLAAVLGALAGGSLPFGWLLLKRYQRLRRFEQQLPDAMELLARSLRAGHSLSDGIRLIGEEMGEPVSSEFRRCYERQNLGLGVERALEEMVARTPNPDLRFFVAAVVVQRQTGGDTAELLDKIARLIRQRFQIRAQVRALTGEGRMSGVVLLALPVLLAVYMYVRDPDYLMPLVREPLGQKMTLTAIGLQILGALIIKKIVNIKV